MEAPADGFAARVPHVVPVADDHAGALELALPAPNGVATDAELLGLVTVGARGNSAAETGISLHKAM
jgi:hypothetical protein